MAAAIKAQVRLDLDGFSRAFAAAIPEQIDSVEADDVKRYLGPFIEDKFREWAEAEGAKVASLLEKLAEDVIAVTNENVAAASAALASRLGPADTDVEIDLSYPLAARPFKEKIESTLRDRAESVLAA